MDFEVCTLPENIGSWMEWQNCIEFEQLFCLIYLSDLDCDAVKSALLAEIPPGPQFDLVRALVSSIDCSVGESICTYEGFYFDKGESS
mmetsp:Transcript_19526/g.40450  ORF Transcript_19526/g.40450 Transcript_19526/m.40450 type:complete len:88 (-) Transcript_19526:1202-1465(-)